MKIDNKIASYYTIPVVIAISLGIFIIAMQNPGHTLPQDTDVEFSQSSSEDVKAYGFNSLEQSATRSSKELG